MDGRAASAHAPDSTDSGDRTVLTHTSPVRLRPRGRDGPGVVVCSEAEPVWDDAARLSCCHRPPTGVGVKR